MLEFVLIIVILVLDQISKYLTELFLSPVGTSYPLWEGVFHFTYTQNRGAAWGLMQGRRTFFIVITVVVCVGLAFFIVKYRKRMHWLPRVALSLVFAGAVGNLIDRVFLAYVRDMFDFCLIHFPIFNVADSALTVGFTLLIFDVLFFKDETLFAFLDTPKREKAGEGKAEGHADDA